MLIARAALPLRSRVAACGGAAGGARTIGRGCCRGGGAGLGRSPGCPAAARPTSALARHNTGCGRSRQDAGPSNRPSRSCLYAPAALEHVMNFGASSNLKRAKPMAGRCNRIALCRSPRWTKWCGARSACEFVFTELRVEPQARCIGRHRGQNRLYLAFRDQSGDGPRRAQVRARTGRYREGRRHVRGGKTP